MKYLGFPLPELEIIYSICAKGCRKIRDAEFLEGTVKRLSSGRRRYGHVPLPGSNFEL